MALNFILLFCLVDESLSLLGEDLLMLRAFFLPLAVTFSLRSAVAIITRTVKFVCVFFPTPGGIICSEHKKRITPQKDIIICEKMCPQSMNST